MLVTRELMAILHVLAGIPSRSGGCYSTRRAHVTKYCSSDRLTRQAAGWIRRVLRTSIRVFARQVIDIHRSKWESECNITPLGCLFDDACDAEQWVALPTNALLSIRVRCARRCRACVSVHGAKITTSSEPATLSYVFASPCHAALSPDGGLVEAKGGLSEWCSHARPDVEISVAPGVSTLVSSVSDGGRGLTSRMSPVTSRIRNFYRTPCVDPGAGRHDRDCEETWKNAHSTAK